MNDANTSPVTSPSISRWVLLLEWITCFGPLTLLWGVAVVILPTQPHVPVDVILGTAIGTLGPVALVLAVMTVFSGQYARRSRIFLVLSLTFAVTTTGHMIGRWWDFDVSVFVLIRLLPLLGCLHLLQLSRQSSAVAVPA